MLSEQYCTVLTAEWETLQSRVRELEARWEKLRQHAGSYGPTLLVTARAWLGVMAELEQLEQAEGDGREE